MAASQFCFLRFLPVQRRGGCIESILVAPSFSSGYVRSSFSSGGFTEGLFEALEDGTLIFPSLSTRPRSSCTSAPPPSDETTLAKSKISTIISRSADRTCFRLFISSVVVHSGPGVSPLPSRRRAPTMWKLPDAAERLFFPSEGTQNPSLAFTKVMGLLAQFEFEVGLAHHAFKVGLLFGPRFFSTLPLFHGSILNSPPQALPFVERSCMEKPCGRIIFGKGFLAVSKGNGKTADLKFGYNIEEGFLAMSKEPKRPPSREHHFARQGAILNSIGNVFCLWSFPSFRMY